jgi:Cd2+/Zn2+-exporting ATPase
MLVAHVLEERSILGAQIAIERLGRLTARTARRLDSDGGEQEVPTEELRPDDQVRVRAGESFPADGCVTEGVSSVDQSSVTGESIPRDVSTGERVYAGSINLTGMLDVRVTDVGSDTALGKVKVLLRSA